MFKTALFLLLLIPAIASAAPKAELWQYWSQHNPDNAQAIDHSDWQHLLKQYVQTGKDGINYVAYKDVSEADKQKLAGYIHNLEQIVITDYNQAEQQAYWINLYNALTVNLILKHYPVESIRDIDISPGLFSSGPWQKKILMIEGQALSLDDVEHRILRPIWKDSRIHYAVNCASIGCPNLQATAFTPENTEQLLHLGAVSYINHERGVKIDGDGLEVSSIYKWFKEDFGQSDKEVIQHFIQYAEEPLKNQLQSLSEIDDYDYDWNLNEN